MNDGFKAAAKKVYDATIGHPLASGKGRHEYAAAQGKPGSKAALKTGVYSPKNMAADAFDAARNPAYNVRNAGMKRRSK